MKEKIIVVPNNLDLVNSLAYHNIKFFNIRIFEPIELAREYLLRNGKICPLEFISKNEELIYYKKIIESINYFNSTKLEDIKRINQSINTIRKLVINDEDKEIKEALNKGIFKEKNDNLYKIYKEYSDILNKENKIDTLGLIRYAINNIKQLDIEIIVLNEYPLQPLELELIKKATNLIQQKSLFDLYEINKKDIHIESYKNCYGSNNEIASLIDDIYTNKNVDECVIACGNYQTYSQIIYDYACKYDLNISYGNGLSLINSYPGKLLKQYYYWIHEGNFGAEPFNKLIYSPYFNFDLLNSYLNFEIENKDDVPNFYDRLSKLRLTNNKEENKQTIIDFKKAISRKDFNDNYKLEKFVPSFEIFANEFSLPIEEFLAKYFKTRKTNEFIINFDECAKKAIVNEIKTIKKIGLDLTDDIIDGLLKKPIYRQGNKPGHLHITSIENALSSLRKNLYICGLSSSIYPGIPKENPLLLDDDLKAFNNEDLTSKGKIKTKRENLFNLISLANALDNNIYLSYPGLNVSELKNNNPSSLLFEIYKKEEGQNISLDDFNKKIIKIGYFGPKLSKTRNIGDAYNDNKIINIINNASNNNKSIPIEINSYSPSALNTFFDCKKRFYFQYVLKIAAPDDYNPYEIISASEQGTLIHSLMEYLPDHQMNKDEFLDLAGKVFDEYMNISVPLMKENIQNTKEQFLEMALNGYDIDNKYKRKIAFKEEDKVTKHFESGINIHGLPDRVELNEDGKAIIIDFKTERRFDAHKKDDVDTCLQVLIYAYIVEKTMNIEIDHCEYRMLRYENGIITCKYDDEIKEKLTNKLIQFKNAIDNNDYSIEPMNEDEEKQKCKYCKYGNICGKVVTKNEQE